MLLQDHDNSKTDKSVPAKVVSKRDYFLARIFLSSTLTSLLLSQCNVSAVVSSVRYWFYCDRHCNINEQACDLLKERMLSVLQAARKKGIAKEQHFVFKAKNEKLDTP